MATLQDQLAAAKTKLASDQDALAKALADQESFQAHLAAINDQLNTLHAAIEVDNKTISDIQAAIAAEAQKPPAPAGNKKLVTGMWPQEGPDWTRFNDLQTKLGFKVAGWRSSSGEGQLDNPFLSPSSVKANDAGHVLSLQIQPKTGKGGSRTGIPYKDITAGKYDTVLLQKLSEFKVLPVGAKYPFEVHSEFDIQNSGAQPPVGPAADYAPFVMHVAALAKQAGVRNRLTFICGTGGLGPWLSNEWKQWITPALIASGAVECFGVDSYAKAKNGFRRPDEITKGVRTAARGVNLPWAVMETGCEEMGDAGGKALWFGQWSTLMAAEGHDCRWLFFNVTLNPYAVESSQASFAGFKKMMASLG